MIVRIVAGPFSDYTGKIDFIDEDKEMLKRIAGAIEHHRTS